jgi:futalosine hydrolase
MFITIIAATPFEIDPLLFYLKEHFKEKGKYLFEKDELIVHLLITGVGIPLTAFSLGYYFNKQKPDLAINAGIAGALNLNLKIGDVVNVVSERFGDLGVEQADGTFTDVHEMGLINSDEAPFQNGILSNPKAIEYQFLPSANGLTVNKVHGSDSSIKTVKLKYKADVESMEGAAFFLSCLMVKVDFLEIRAISNFVEPRNKENWNIPLAIENLNQILIEMIKAYL